ncbi:ATP-dependent DNA helicase Rep [Buchnera aphidicola (Eriosoma grossulariae)]|uniref:UvrD-helicase domain-containing protein n=1 Tax=Buchnera aphidicola TaxID=9 RepID=UPI0034644EB4
MHLNLIQEKAVKCVKGPCLVLAGAGSGKTKVIISKIIYLINNCNYNIKNIAAMTFTNKAAQEMKYRISEILGQKYLNELQISTFHTLGMEIIKSDIHYLGRNANFLLFDEHDQLNLLNDITKKKFKKNKLLLKKLLSSISKWKMQLIDPKQAKNIVKTDIDSLFANYYDIYHQHLITYNILDFDDLIYLPTLLLKKYLSVKNKWSEKIQYFLVDEYQDTNTSQYEFIKLLSNKRSDFTLVGDNNQSIYSWRGACSQNFSLLKTDFPNITIIKMEQNYRSTGRILRVANILISHNNNEFEKKLFSELDYGSKIKILVLQNEEKEAKKIIQVIYSHKNRFNNKYSDYAILYRGNYQARLFEKELIKYDIAYEISGSNSFFSRGEIKDLLSYLRLIDNQNDDLAFLRVVNIPSRSIGTVTINKLIKWSSIHKKSLFFASLDMGLQTQLNRYSLKKLRNFSIWIKNIIQEFNASPIIALKKLIHDINYKEWIKKSIKDIHKIQSSINNIDLFIKWIIEMLKGNNIQKSMTLSQIITHFTLRDVFYDINNNNKIDKLQLMTLHASKGLEFKYVFIIGMEEGILPHYNGMDNDNLDEERRLIYVGITRAKKQLVFTLCKQRNQYGQIFSTIPSRFLLELPQDDLYWIDQLYPKSCYNKEELSIMYLKKIRQSLNIIN